MFFQTAALVLLPTLLVLLWSTLMRRPRGVSVCCVASPSERAGRLLGDRGTQSEQVWHGLDDEGEAEALFHAVMRRLIAESVGHTMPLFGLWLVREFVQDLLRDMSVQDVWRGPDEDEIEERGEPGHYQIIVEETWTSWLARMASNMRASVDRACSASVLALRHGRHQKSLARVRASARQYYLDTPAQNRARCVPLPDLTYTATPQPAHVYTATPPHPVPRHPICRDARVRLLSPEHIILVVLDEIIEFCSEFDSDTRWEPCVLGCGRVRVATTIANGGCARIVSWHQHLELGCWACASCGTELLREQGESAMFACPRRRQPVLLRDCLLRSVRSGDVGTAAGDAGTVGGGQARPTQVQQAGAKKRPSTRSRVRLKQAEIPRSGFGTPKAKRDSRSPAPRNSA
jgi:hypothetical protein